MGAYSNTNNISIGNQMMKYDKGIHINELLNEEFIYVHILY